MDNRDSNWWDNWFLGMAKYVATASKDPSTQVGAVIVNSKRIPVGIGYNGFPRGVKDLQSRLNTRELKLKYMHHAEVNAIQNANGPVEGCTIYCTMASCCHDCARYIIQAGIKRVVLPNAPVFDRWRESWDYAETMFNESGVIISAINIPIKETLN